MTHSISAKGVSGLLWFMDNQVRKMTGFLFSQNDLAIPAILSDYSISYKPTKNEWNNYENSRITKNAVQPLPQYVFATSDIVTLNEKKKLTIGLDSTLSEAHIFYRYHWDDTLFEQEKWQAKNAISASNHTFYLQPGTYQFAIFATPDANNDSIEVYQFELSEWIPEK